MNKSTPRYLFGEGLVIIASILIAFGIQAWWEESQENEEASRVLESILREHRRNVEEIDSWEKSALLLDEAIIDIADVDRDDTTITSAQFDELLSRLTFYSGPNVSFNSLENLISGGRLALIDDLTLRENLARWNNFKAYYQNLVRTEVGYLDSQFVPYLIRNGAYLQIVKKTSNQPDYDIGVLRSLPIGDAVDHRRVFRDAEFLGLLSWRYLYRQDYRQANKRFMRAAPEFEHSLLDALGRDPGGTTLSREP